jgi:hypothetical protein
MAGRPPRPLLHHPGRDVRGDGGYDASRDDDDDDFSDLQRLISLARLPYCRVTKTFGKGGSFSYIIGTSTTTSNATLATAASSPPPPPTTTTHDSENLPPRSCVHVPKGDEAPRPRKRTLDHSPVAAARNHHHRRALRQWRPALARSNYSRDDAAPGHRNDNERFELGKDENNDGSSNGGGGVSVGKGPLPVQPLLPGEAGVVAAVAAGIATASAAASVAAISAGRGPVVGRKRGGGARQSDHEENREFVKSNFDPIGGSEGGGFSHACRVCSQQVACRNNKAVEDLLRHAMVPFLPFATCQAAPRIARRRGGSGAGIGRARRPPGILWAAALPRLRRARNPRNGSSRSRGGSPK